MSATSGIFDSQFTAENSVLGQKRKENETLKMHFRRKTKLAETTTNCHFRRQNRNAVGLYVATSLEESEELD